MIYINDRLTIGKYDPWRFLRGEKKKVRRFPTKSGRGRN